MRFSAVLVAAAATATAVAWLVVWLVRRNAPRLGLIDQPNHRSSHRQPTPRGGGIGIVLGAASGLTVAFVAGAAMPVSVWTVLAVATVVGVVGLVDDFRRLPPTFRLVAQGIAAAAVIATTGPMKALPLPAPLDLGFASIAGWIFSLLWIMALTNFFNFMDGIDGLAGGQAVASFLGVVLAGWSEDATLLAACAGAASLGFLVHNWSPARVFMGDVGSGFLGFLIAALPFLAPIDRRTDSTLAVAIGMTLFLLDPLETLFRRAAAKKNLTAAHREHIYQQFVEPGESAGAVSGGLVAAGLALSVLGAITFLRPGLAWAALAISLVMYLGERFMARRRARVRQRLASSPTGVDRE